MHNMEQRLTDLEARVNRYRNLSVLLALVLGGAVFMGAAAEDAVLDVVKTRRLEVVNQEGAPIVTAGAGRSASGLLKVNSKTGGGLFAVGAGQYGNGILEISSRSGQGLVYAGAGKAGDGVLRVKSRRGKTVIRAGTDGSNENAFVELLNTKGQSVVELYADDANNGFIGVWDTHGKSRNLTPR